MDIEQLSKSQIVLLTLLVSFVTSIATGIVTVSLMEQAPPIVAQTVNRIVERTVETVSATPNSQTGAAIVTQEKTIVVKESEQISAALSTIGPSLVRIFQAEKDGGALLGIGIVMDSSGTILTDISTVAPGADTVIALSDGTRANATVSARNTASGVAYLTATSTDGSALTWKPASFSADAPLIGQAVVSVAGKSVMRVAEGIITTMLADGTVVDTDIDMNAILPGSPLINLDGVVVGVSTSAARTSSKTGFISAALIIAQSREE